MDDIKKSTDRDVLKKALERAVDNGYVGKIPIGDEITDYYPIIFSHDFARAFWGDEYYLVGNIRSAQLKEYVHHLQSMIAYQNPIDYLRKFFIELKKVKFNHFVFGKDVFLRTDYLSAIDSKDDWSAKDEAYCFHYKPVSLVSDFWDGEEFARALLKKFPGKSTLLDLGTATGSVPLTMRKTKMKALGLEGLPVESFELKPYMLKNPYLFCWDIAPNILGTCDITQPFRIEGKKGGLVKFDFIISTDCFEHLVTKRIPVLMENIYNHLSDDGYGIFEINMIQWMGIHQTCKPEKWWRSQFRKKFEICEELSYMDFPYVRSTRKDGVLTYKNGMFDPGKFLLWVKKKDIDKGIYV